MMTHDENNPAAAGAETATAAANNNVSNHNRPTRSLDTRKARLGKGGGGKAMALKDGHNSRGHHHRPGSANNGALQDPDDGDNSSSGSEFDGGDSSAMDTNSVDTFSSTLVRKVRRVNGLSNTDQEIVRLVGQHLTNIGLTSSAAVLMAEAGCRLDQPTAAKFRNCVMGGEWSHAVKSK